MLKCSFWLQFPVKRKHVEFVFKAFLLLGRGERGRKVLVRKDKAFDAFGQLKDLLIIKPNTVSTFFSHKESNWPRITTKNRCCLAAAGFVLQHFLLFF